MKKPHLLLLAALLSFGFLTGQNMSLNWSDPIVDDNKIDGFFDDFIGYNSSYMYVKYANGTINPKKANHKIVIKGLDKETMKEKFSKTIIDFSSGDKDKYAGLKYYKCAIYDDLIYFFWKKDTREAEELYVRTFDIKMKQIQGLKKIYELKKDNSKGAKQPEVFVLYNKNRPENILIGGEMAAANGQTIKVEYKLMKTDLTFLQSRQVELPISKTGRSYDGFSSSYEYGDDGKLFIYSSISPTREERKQMKKEDKSILSGYYDIISSIDLNNGNLKSFTVKFENKYIKGYKAIIDNNSVRLTGFFCDLSKDPRGNDNHGLFYLLLDDKDLSTVSSKFNYFTIAQLGQLFAKDNKNEGKDRTGIFASKKKKASEEESLSSLYNIEQIIKSPSGELLLFGSRMHNYSVTHCTQTKYGQSCYTRYYCQKDNITAFKLSPTGELIWATNVDRRSTYERWNVYDVSVAVRGDKYYVLYASDFQINSTKKNMRSKKSGSQQRDRIEYAIFDGATGTATRQEQTVNPLNVKKEERKGINASNITVINNTFYTNSARRKWKPGKLIACIVCWPLSGFFTASPSSYKGTNYIGKISPK